MKGRNETERGRELGKGSSTSPTDSRFAPAMSAAGGNGSGAGDEITVRVVPGERQDPNNGKILPAGTPYADLDPGAGFYTLEVKRSTTLRELKYSFIAGLMVTEMVAQEGCSIENAWMRIPRFVLFLGDECLSRSDEDQTTLGELGITDGCVLGQGGPGPVRLKLSKPADKA